MTTHDWLAAIKSFVETFNSSPATAPKSMAEAYRNLCFNEAHKRSLEAYKNTIKKVTIQKTTDAPVGLVKTL